MRRDMNLIRTILMRIEDLTSSPRSLYAVFPEYIQNYKPVPGFEEQLRLVEEYFRLLVQSGFVDGDSREHNVRGLTWDGHNLIDKLRDMQL